MSVSTGTAVSVKVKSKLQALDYDILVPENGARSEGLILATAARSPLVTFSAVADKDEPVHGTTYSSVFVFLFPPFFFLPFTQSSVTSGAKRERFVTSVTQCC